MSRLSFSRWLGENIQEWRGSKYITRDGSKLILEEKENNFCMKVEIENTSPHLVVIKFDPGDNETTYFKRSGEFSRRCDFLVLEETSDEYIVYFIELKGKVPHEGGASQLRWSDPFLRYIMSVFLADSLRVKPDKSLRVKAFQIGKDYSQWANKGFMKRQQKRRFQICDSFSGPDFLYCTYQGHRLEFKDFRQG